MMLYLIGPSGLTLENATTLASLQLFAALFILFMIVLIKTTASNGNLKTIKSN